MLSLQFPTAVLPLFESTAKPECNHNNCIWCLSLVKHDNVSDASTTCSRLIYPYGLLGKIAAPVKGNAELNFLSAHDCVHVSFGLCVTHLIKGARWQQATNQDVHKESSTAISRPVPCIIPETTHIFSSFSFALVSFITLIPYSFSSALQKAVADFRGWKPSHSFHSHLPFHFLFSIISHDSLAVRCVNDMQIRILL